MPTFNNLSQLYKYLQKQVEDVARDEVSKEGVEKLRESIDETVYSKPEGDYDRTFAMKNSSTADVKKTKDGVEIEVYNNPELMNYEYPSWMPEKYGSDHREDIVKWLNYGTDSPLYSHPAHNFIEKAEEKLEKSAKKVLKEGLQKRGINAE